MVQHLPFCVFLRDRFLQKKIPFQELGFIVCQPSPHFVNVEKVFRPKTLLQKGYFISLDLQVTCEYTFNFDGTGGGLAHSETQFLKGYFFLQIPVPKKSTKRKVLHHCWRLKMPLQSHQVCPLAVGRSIYKASLASSPETPCKTRRDRKRAWSPGRRRPVKHVETENRRGVQDRDALHLL